MNDLQQKLLSMLEWFHDFCGRNGLKYYSVGGTTLGAIRHHGFIPWDDDIDIAMPRSDFNRLIEMKVTEGIYRIESFKEEAPDFVYPFAKIYDTSTTVIEDTQHKTKRGISIDVFPLDGIGDSMEEAHKNYKRINRWLDFLTARVSAYRKGRSILKNASIFFANAITKKILPINWILNHIDSICSKYDFNESIFVGNLVGAWRYREILEREFFGEPKLYPFENIMIYGPEKAKDYLKRIYGNWEKIPPEEKRKTTHAYLLCDLSHSYLNNKT